MPRSAYLLAGLLLALSAGPGRAQCPGDLNGDGAVTVQEVIAMVNTALHGCPAPSRAVSCPEDLNGDGTVTVDEILRAVAAALSSCPTPTSTSGLSIATATPTTTPVSAPPTFTATETATFEPSTATPTATETATSEPSTASPTATETATSEPSTPTPTGTETTSPSPSPTPTDSPTPVPSACPYTFLDDTLGQGISCDYLGPFNSDPDCPTDLETLLTGDGSLLGVGIDAAPDIVTFIASVTSATSATLIGYTIGSDTTVFSIGGTIELQQNGQVLIIAPDSPPFDLATADGTNQCAFVQYTGTYAGVLEASSAPAAPPQRHTRGVQLASFQLR
jgi:hypothetical protein